MIFETKRGEAIRHGGRILIPVGRSWTMPLPGGRGAFVWNRPLGLEVEGPGEKVFLPVPDRTRRGQWGLLAAGFAVFLLSRFFRGR